MRALLISSILAIISHSAWSQAVPALTNYQGRLTDANGNAAPDGTGYEIELRLWPAATGGAAPIWATRFTGVAVKSGALNLILGGGGTPIAGATTADLKTAFANSSVFLGMTVTKGATGTPIANPTEILPRQQWMISPFSFRADTVAPNGVNSAAIVDESIEKTDLSTSLQTELSSLAPPGTVIAFAGSNVPAGWLKCDGANVSRTTYSALFAAVGTAHGSGDGSTIFTLPDYRGFFLRGINEGGVMPDGVTGRDPDANSRVARAPGGASGNTVGSVQYDELKAHAHTWDFFPIFGTSPGGGGFAVGVGGSKVTNATGGAETRPKNAYVLYIIKY